MKAKDILPNLPDPTAELQEEKPVDPFELAAREKAAEIYDILTDFQRVHRKLLEGKFGDGTLNKFNQLVKQTYWNMKQDIPNIYREGAVQEIEAELLK